MTSHDVVARARRALGTREVGHTGTLDPMATGVLPLVVGEGTKLAPFLQADDKEYEGELELGLTTDTLDIEGTVTARAPADIAEDTLRAAMRALTGDLAQVPPMYSAIKQGGQTLHKLARKGIEVEREARPVRVDRFELVDFAGARARFVVACSKGTYVRALVRDLGAALACGATLTALRRTRAGRFTLAGAVALEELAAARLIPPPEAVAHLPAIALDAAEVAEVGYGRPLAAPPGTPGGPLRLLTPDGHLAAIAEEKDGRLPYLRVFNYHRKAG